MRSKKASSPRYVRSQLPPFPSLDPRLRTQREFGDRTYKAMWRRYKYRVLIAMSAQFCAQLVRPASFLPSLQLADF